MDSVKFGAFIAETRKECGMTQQELAKKLSVTNKAVSRWETGSGFPDINILEPLADALGVSILELMRSERLSVRDEQTSQALSDTIELANLRRDRREFIIAAMWLSALGLILIALAVFMPSGVTVWTLPLVFCSVSGLGCLLYAVKKRRKGLPSALWFAASAVLLIVPIVQIVILLLMFVMTNFIGCF